MRKEEPGLPGSGREEARPAPGEPDAVDVQAAGRVARPFAHGRFAHPGPGFRYEVSRYDVRLHRFWFQGGPGFEVAAWDWPLCADWCWSCGDDFAVYDDPDHVGWYLAYNVRLGTYVHVMYLGM